MSREIRRRVVSWLARWRFATLVALEAAFAGWAAASVPVPMEIPSFALEASLVYRLEVGAVAFVFAYGLSLALVLALNNRAFSEIGTAGVRAHDIGDELRVRRRLDALMRSVERIQAENEESQVSEGYNDPDDN